MRDNAAKNKAAGEKTVTLPATFTKLRRRRRHNAAMNLRPIIAILALAATAAAALTVELDIASGKIGGVPVNNLHLRAESTGGSDWRISGSLPATRLAGSPLDNTHLDARLRRAHDTLTLEDLNLRGTLGGTALHLHSDRLILANILRGELRLPPESRLTLRAGTHRLHTTLAYADGSAAIRADLPLALLEPLLKQQQLGGDIRPALTIRRTGAEYHVSGGITLHDARYNSADSLRAAEHLRGSIRLDLHGGGKRWQGDIALTLRAGEILLTPYYYRHDGAPLTARLHLDYRPDRLRVRDLTVADAHAAARADLDWDRRANRLTALSLHHLTGDADHLYRRYLQPYLGDGLFGDAALKGSLYLRGSYRDGQMRDLAAVFHHLHITDRQGRYQLRDLDGQTGDDGSPSRLTLAGGRWHKLPVGAIHADYRWDARGITLEKPLHIPILDGGITVERLEPQQDGYTLSARIAPISLARLGDALDTIRFPGSLGGTLPDIRLNRDGLQLQQPVNLSTFGGTIHIDHLHIRRFFSDAPYAGFALRLHDLDLQQLTNAFGIGEIEGRIEGEATDVILTNWHPQHFRARLYTPPHNPGHRRISHEAVAYLARAGGGNLMLNQFIRVLNRFPYERLGFTAHLENGVLTLDGIAPAQDGSGGYYLVKGRGLPHLDIIGHTRKIDWQELLDRLKSASNSEGAQVESKLGR